MNWLRQVDWGYFIVVSLIITIGVGVISLFVLSIPDETEYKVEFCQDIVVDGKPTQQCWQEWVPESELRQP